MKVKTYAQFAIGDSSHLTRVITEEDVKRFADLSGDDNPLHVDHEFASRTDFKHRVVHGMLAGNLVSALIGRQLPGPGALWVSQEFKFLAPVRIGDRLMVSATVVRKHDRDELLELDVRATVDGRGEVLRGKGLVKVVRVLVESQAEPNAVPVRRALVTGASGSIGSQIALALSKSGVEVVAQYVTGHERAHQLADSIEQTGGRCHLIKCDLRDSERMSSLVQDALSRVGQINILVANASLPIKETSLLNTSPTEIDETITVQLHSTMAIARELFPGMVSQRWGRVIAISSDAVHAQPTKGWLAYNIGKVSLEMFIRQCAVELAPSGVTANSVAPGMTDSDFISNFPARSRQVVANITPNRRLGRSSDIAEIVAFLSSESAGHINGQVIRVNGGIGVV